jgi:enamine deaminase RidA (YjgF/YER057c/UK114 family)
MKAAFETLDVRFLERKNCTECWINSSENLSHGVAVIQNVLDYLQTHKFNAVSMRLFGNRAAITQASAFLETKMAEFACRPVLILQNDSIQNLSIQVYALSGKKPKVLSFEDEFVGCQFEDDYAKYYMLRILPDNQSKSQFSQSQNIFEKAHKILESCDLGFSDTIRTWLFADDILSWYGQLNKARNEFFEHHDIYNKLIPASTGIGVANPYNKALIAQLLVVSPKNKNVEAHSINSPLQCPALNYKSSFSRAVKLGAPDHSRIYISGTASIDKEGNSVFRGDTRAQLEFTMRMVKAILNETDMDWSDTVSSIVYFKHRQDFGLFDDYCQKQNIKLPHIKVQADACRDDLLFELELDAVNITQ